MFMVNLRISSSMLKATIAASIVGIFIDRHIERGCLILSINDFINYTLCQYKVLHITV